MVGHQGFVTGPKFYDTIVFSPCDAVKRKHYSLLLECPFQPMLMYEIYVQGVLSTADANVEKNFDDLNSNYGVSQFSAL